MLPPSSEANSGAVSASVFVSVGAGVVAAAVMVTVYQIVSRSPSASVAVSCTRPRNAADGVPDISAVEELTVTPSGSQLVE